MIAFAFVCGVIVGVAATLFLLALSSYAPQSASIFEGNDYY